MLVDGTSIAASLKREISARIVARKAPLRLGVLVVHETPEIRTFVKLKERFGAEVGVTVKVLRLDTLKQTTEAVLSTLLHATHEHDGLIVQLPLPASCDLDAVVQLFPLTHDVDVIGSTAYQQFKEGALPFLPPVVGAFAEILKREGVSLTGSKVVVVGEGRLVGAPAALWAARHGAQVMVATRETPDLAALTRAADVVILGAGSPGLLTPDMVQEGVVILDAGTSESEGMLRGDADPACADRARLFTPTPGGIGPITVAKVFENLVALVALKERRVKG